MTTTPVSLTYASVVSLDTIRIMLANAALNALEVKASDIKITSYKIEAKAKASGIACASGKFGDAETKQFVAGAAKATGVAVNDVAVTDVADCKSRRRLESNVDVGAVQATHRRRLSASTTVDYKVSTTDASVGASMAKAMNDPKKFAAELVKQVNLAPGPLTLNATDVAKNAVVPEVTTEIKYEVQVKDADAAKSVIAVTSDVTKMTAVANDAKVDGTPSIPSVKAEALIGDQSPSSLVAVANNPLPEQTSETPVGAIVGGIVGALALFLCICICCAPGKFADSMRDALAMGRVCCGDGTDKLPFEKDTAADTNDAFDLEVNDSEHQQARPSDSSAHDLYWHDPKTANLVASHDTVPNNSEYTRTGVTNRATTPPRRERARSSTPRRHLLYTVYANSRPPGYSCSYRTTLIIISFD